MKTYVIHYDRLHKRREALEPLLKKNNLNAEWLIQSGYYPDGFIEKYFQYTTREWKRKARIANRPIIFRPLTRSEIHLTINHFLVGERIVDGQDEIALVLEDDAILVDGFHELLQKALLKLKGLEWDIAYLDYLGGKPPRVQDQEIIKERGKYDYYGTCAYLIKREAWEKMLGLNEKFTLPADEEIKYRINRLGLTPAWLVPPLVTQSSLHAPAGESGQDKREKQGVKKFLFWRKSLYSIAPRFIRTGLYKAEETIKRLILGIE